MKFKFFFGLLSLLIISCTQKSKNEATYAKQDITEIPSPIKQSPIDTSKIAVIEFDQTGNWPFDNSCKPISLSKNELIVIDSLLHICANNYNKQLEEIVKKSYKIDFKNYNYKLQYVAVVNNKGEKEVWINGFCDPLDHNWKKEIIHVKDGGNCFFNLKINLSTKSCSNISVNGYT
ncbi:hypothetical protein [Adhaeribacter terreus]|uniref:Lipoprotein n=1 Tax=Adhaeribacter terreus TaxID=529703 RepID=A0ABW0E8T4_9BACT